MGVPDSPVISKLELLAGVDDDAGASGSSNDVILTLLKGIVWVDEGIAVEFGGSCDWVTLFGPLEEDYQLMFNETALFIERTYFMSSIPTGTWSASARFAGGSYV